jgi:serine/threonine protein kinase
MDGEYRPNHARVVGTNGYRAPEIICHANRYGKPVDMWAVGCVLLELLLRATGVFSNEDHRQQLEQIMSRIAVPPDQELRVSGFTEESLRIIAPMRRTVVSWPENIGHPNFTHDAMDLLNQALCFNPELRITAREALDHPYFRGFARSTGNRASLRRFNWDIERGIRAGMPRIVVQTRMLEIMNLIRARNLDRNPVRRVIDLVRMLQEEVIASYAQVHNGEFTVNVRSIRSAVTTFQRHLTDFLGAHPQLTAYAVNAGGGFFLLDMPANEGEGGPVEEAPWQEE